EEHWRGTLAEAVEHIGEVEPRGEYVLVLDGAPPPGEVDDAAIAAALAAAREGGATTRDAVGEVASSLNVSRRRVYALANQRAVDTPPAAVDAGPGAAS